jgi:hypothetical protein
MQLYPQLVTPPSTSFTGQSTAATLGLSVQADRRYNGAMLQSARNGLSRPGEQKVARVKVEDEEEVKEEEDVETATTALRVKEEGMSRSLEANKHASGVSLGSPESDSSMLSDSSGGQSREEYDRWITTMRIVENLTDYVRRRLDNRDYIDDVDGRGVDGTRRQLARGECLRCQYG